MPFSNTRETYITLVDLLNFLKVISERTSEFFLNIFVGISESSDAFAILNSKISFSISFVETVFKENYIFRDL